MKVTFKKDEYVLLDDTNKIIANYIVTKGAKGDTGAGEDNIIEDVKVNNNSLPVTSKSVNIDLTGYVEKETGKGLSTNDYTTAEKTKLAGIEESADVNVIENVKVNGVAQTVTNKAVDISVPINTSDLTNDSDFVTSTDLASHLVNVSNEVDEDYKVNFIHSRNLFDKNNYNILSAYFDTNYTISSATNPRLIYIECEGSTTYTIQKIKSARLRVATTPTTPAIGGGIQDYQANDSGTSQTITTSASAKYLLVYCYQANEDTLTLSQILNTLIIQEGSSIITSSIAVDNETFSDTLKVGTDVDGRSRVNIIRQVNNILPKGTIYTLSTGSVSLNFKVPKANTQYTMKTNLPATSDSALVFFGSGANASVNSTTNGVWVGSPRTMTSDANGYVTIAFRYLSNLSNIKLGDYWYTLAEGTLGVDYIAPIINVDGENEFFKNVYSTSEVVIGEWFGKPLYRKVINFGNMPNNNVSYIAHNISNLENKVNIYGFTSDYYQIPFRDLNSGNSISTWANNSNIFIRDNFDGSNIKATLVIEYTKSTD